MQVQIKGALPDRSPVFASGVWPEAVGIFPGSDVIFAQFGVRYIGQIATVTVDLGDATNGRPAHNPVTINVTNVRDAGK